MATWVVTALPVVPLLAILLATPGVEQPQQAGAESHRLPTTTVPDHYDLTFVVDLAHARFEGTESIRVTVREPTQTIVLNSLDIEFRDVTIGSSPTGEQKASVSIDQKRETATLTVPQTIAQGPAEVHIRYAGRLSDKLRGFYVSKGRGRTYAVTQFESTDARRAFPCFDEPAFKATFRLTLVVDRGDTAISNGKLVSDRPGPTTEQHTMAFATSPKMSSYLVAMAVGDFQCLEGARDAVPIRICATPDKKDLGQIALESAKRILRFYDSYFTIKYPYGKLDVVAVPDFAAGAMENTAAIFYREADLLADTQTASVATRRRIASVLAHEMAHQWFGDLVTMQWWDDIWLNEGFATWMANHPLAAWKPEWDVPVLEGLETQAALNLDSLNSTRPIHARVETPAEIEEAFDAIAYEKGAAVLRMIEHYVGAETFRRGVNAYLRAYAYGNATSQDFWGTIARATGKPVDTIMPTFVNQPGLPLITVSLVCDDSKTETRATLTQTRFVLDPAQGTSDGRIRWEVPVCLKSDVTEKGSKAPLHCRLFEAGTETIVAAHGCVHWVYANAGAVGYYRTEYAPEVLRAMAPHVEDALTPPERLSLIGDEWALVRARRHSVADYLTLASGFGREHSSGVLSLVSERLSFVHQYLTTDATRTPFEAFTHALLRPLFDEVGWTAQAADNDQRRELRATLIGALGTMGADPDVITKMRAALDAALSGGSRLDATIAGAIVRVAAEHGDAKLYDALMAAAERATSPEDHDRYLFAVTDFRDPALIDRGLQYALSPQLRSQDTAVYLARFMANPAARTRAWSFVTEHWTELEPKIMIAEGDTTLVSSLARFCDLRARDDITAFFATHKLPVAARTLNQTIEQIANCAALRESQTGVLTEWIRKRSR